MPVTSPRFAPVHARRLLAFAGALFALAGCLQIEIRDRVRYRWSIAQSGLILREGPGLQYARIGTIPYGGKVRLIGPASRRTILGGQAGRWSRVVYGGLLGYSFDAFLSDAPPEPDVAPPGPPAPSPRKNAEKPSVRPSPPTSGPVVSTPPSAAKASQLRQPPPSPAAFAYAAHDPPGLIKMSRTEFRKIAPTLGSRFRRSKSAFRDLAAAREEEESVEGYLRRSEEAKRRFLAELRQDERAAAVRIFSIYDAGLELGSYHPDLGRFAWLGTSVPIDTPGMITLPGDRTGAPRFVNGRRYNVKIPPGVAAEIRKARKEILVRIDFSYTETLEDLFDWTRQAYFLPRYLALYDPGTGRIYYECRALPRVEVADDPAAPLRVSSRLLDETVR